MTGRTDGIGGEVPAGLVSWVEPSAKRTDVQGEGLVWHTSTLTIKFRRCAPIFIFKKMDTFIVLAGGGPEICPYLHTHRGQKATLKWQKPCLADVR